MKEKLSLSIILPIKSSKSRDFNEYFEKAMNSIKTQTVDIEELIIVHTPEESLVEHFNNVWAEFCYIMKDGVWYMFDQDNTELRLLSEELAKVTEEV